MAFRYETVVPWGRSYQEYIDMFRLTGVDLERSILGCGDGPASFNGILTKKGGKVISIDPIYRLSKSEIAERIEATCQNVIEQTRRNQEKFLWNRIKSVDKLGKVRMSAMTDFLADYEDGRREGRYVPAELPRLPFEDKRFALSLVSHFLFLYSDNLTLEFHFEAIDEILRVAGEARIFPVLGMNAERSPYVDEVIRRYNDRGYLAEEVLVDYEFQKGGNTMLKISESR